MDGGVPMDGGEPTDGGGLVSYNARYDFEAGADARDETLCNLEIDDHECH